MIINKIAFLKLLNNDIKLILRIIIAFLKLNSNYFIKVIIIILLKL